MSDRQLPLLVAAFFFISLCLISHTSLSGWDGYLSHWSCCFKVLDEMHFRYRSFLLWRHHAFSVRDRLQRLQHTLGSVRASFFKLVAAGTLLATTLRRSCEPSLIKFSIDHVDHHLNTVPTMSDSNPAPSVRSIDASTMSEADLKSLHDNDPFFYYSIKGTGERWSRLQFYYWTTSLSLSHSFMTCSYLNTFLAIRMATILHRDIARTDLDGLKANARRTRISFEVSADMFLLG